MIGLISAAQNYKPQKDATFSSYANLRIKGEIKAKKFKIPESMNNEILEKKHRELILKILNE